MAYQNKDGKNKANTDKSGPICNGYLSLVDINWII